MRSTMLHAFHTRDANAERVQIELHNAQIQWNRRAEAWLDDYLTAVKFQQGTNITAMQYVQLMLDGSARHWLKNLRRGSISSRSQFRGAFIENFKSMYKRPASLEELRACKQGTRETLRAYIQRWTILKNSAEDISDESAIDAFRRGLQRVEFKEQLGQMKVRTLTRLLELANSWADGEDSVRNETETHTARSEHDYDYNGDRGADRRRKRPRRNFYDDRGPDMVAAGFPDDRNGRQRDDNRPQRRDNLEDEPQAQKREWRTRQPHDSTRAFRSAKEQLDGLCSIHGFRNERGELRSSHTLRNCRTFNELAEEKNRSAAATVQTLASIAVGPA